VCFIAEADVQRAGIGLRIDRNGAQPETACGARNAAGDLATIGDQDGFEHAGLRRLARS
jgi:hypothetical protein